MSCGPWTVVFSEFSGTWVNQTIGMHTHKPPNLRETAFLERVAESS